MDDSRKPPIWTKSFIGISLTQHILFIVFYALLTTLPLYVVRELNGSNSDGGLVVTAMLVAAILIRVVSAKIIEKIGIKKGLVYGVIAFSITTFGYIWIHEFGALLTLRFIHGLSFGLLTTATGTLVANIVPTERHGEGIGYFSMAMNLAMVLGPFIALTLLQFTSFQLLFVVLSLITIGAVFLSFIVQVPYEESAQESRKAVALSLHDFIEVKALPISAIMALSSFAYASIISFVSVYGDSIGLARAVSYFFLVYSIAMLISRPYFGKKFDTRGPAHAIIPGLLFFTIGLILLSFTSSSWMLLLSAVFTGLGYGTVTPSFQTMAIQTTSRARSGHATATFFMALDLGLALGALLLGFVVEILGFSVLYQLSAVLALVVLGLFIMMHKKNRQYDKV